MSQDVISVKAKALERASLLLAASNPRDIYTGRQLLFNVMPVSDIVEKYLYVIGKPQLLDDFPMLRDIYNYRAKKTLLKCSRKVLKSTIISNLLAINAIKLNNFFQIYVTPSEQQTKRFSANYLKNLFYDSPKLSPWFGGLDRDDVFEKILTRTRSNILLSYASTDASRLRGPHSDWNYYDEVQDIDYDVLSIIEETKTQSDYKYSTFAGTPLSMHNTIEQIWQSSTQNECGLKCPHCGDWSFVIPDHDPIKMIREDGMHCHKCEKLLDPFAYAWVAQQPERDVVGWHMSQPMQPRFSAHQDLPAYRQRWEDIYTKVHKDKMFTEEKIYNEVLGLSYENADDIPITEHELLSLCTLGPMTSPAGDLLAYKKGRSRYHYIAAGADWGVNHVTSYTACVLVGVREDGVMEVFFAKVFHNRDYMRQIDEIAGLVKAMNCGIGCDSGPDPIRGYELIDRLGPGKVLMAQYTNSNVVQRTVLDAKATDLKEARWQLHKADTMGIVFRLLKAGRILFPSCDANIRECFDHILNERMEVVDHNLRQHYRYVHAAESPDDFLHALNYAVCLALVGTNSNLLAGASSTPGNAPDEY